MTSNEARQRLEALGLGEEASSVLFDHFADAERREHDFARHHLRPVLVARGGHHWHAEQVASTLAWFVREAGSFERRMSWFPWQSEQTALPVSPAFFDATPWTLCSYAAIAFWSGRLYFFSIAWSLWHRRQVATMLRRKVRAAGSFGFHCWAPAGLLTSSHS